LANGVIYSHTQITCAATTVRSFKHIMSNLSPLSWWNKLGFRLVTSLVISLAVFLFLAFSLVQTEARNELEKREWQRIELANRAIVEALQQNASVIVGEILGVDLSTTNIYDIEIVDSTDTEAVAAAVTDAGDAASITNTLTLVNASLAAVTGEEGSTIAETINSYVQTVAVVAETVVEALVEETDIASALADPAAVTALGDLADAQVEISDQATLIEATIVQDAVDEGIDVVIETEEIPSTVEAITEVVVEDVPLDIVTGATGAVSG